MGFHKKIIVLLSTILLTGSAITTHAQEEVILPDPNDITAVQEYINSLPLLDQCALYATSNKSSNYIETDIATTALTYQIIDNALTITGYNGECHGILTIAPSYTVDGISYPVNKIAYRAFYRQIYMTAIILPENITTIGRGAFMDCVSLQVVYLPSTVTNIYDYAFRNCVTLTDIYYPYNFTEWNAMQIGDNNSLLVDAIRHYNTAK